MLRDILKNKVDHNQLKAIIFTHGHFDHIGGLYSLLGFLRMVGRKEVLKIFTPQGSEEVPLIIESFLKNYSSTMPFQILCKKIRTGEKFQVASMTIETFPVMHCGSIDGGGILDRIPALGYRISYDGEIVAISGDTGICDSLKNIVTGADLAIIEAVIEKSEGADKEILRRVHLSEDIAAEYGRLAKNFILIHQGKRGKEMYD